MSKLNNVSFWLILTAIVIATIYLHIAASSTFPVPWGDEAYLVWQARAFERWNSFIAPELDANRPMFLLPFVYGATLGTVFKAFGYSLETARWLSLTFVLASISVLAVVVRRHSMPLVALTFSGLFFLNKFFVVLGNVARMEAMVIAVVCATLVMLQRGYLWTALALMSVTPMIHPNGMYFLVPLIAYLWALGVFKERPDPVAIVLLGVSATTWLANGLYALNHWSGFLHELAYRFGETKAKHDGFSQFLGWPIVELGIIVLTVGLARWRQIPVGYLLVIALGSWIANYARIEQWYEPYRDLAYLLASLALIEIAVSSAASAHLSYVRRLNLLVGTVVATCLLLPMLYIGRLEGPRNYVADMNVYGMRAETSVTYFGTHDRQAIQATLDSLDQDCPAVVEIYPWGDALLIADQDERKIRFQLPYFDPFFQPENRWIWGYEATEGALADLYLVHLSRYHPRILDDRQNRYLAHVAKKSGVDPSIIYSRDETEIWYVFRPDRKARSLGNSGEDTNCFRS